MNHSANRASLAETALELPHAGAAPRLSPAPASPHGTKTPRLRPHCSSMGQRDPSLFRVSQTSLGLSVGFASISSGRKCQGRVGPFSRQIREQRPA